MPNAVSAFLDDTVAGGAADRPAIVTPGGATTYRELPRPAGSDAGTLGALLAAAAPECAPEPMSGDDTAFWLYTSGTTGGAKAAVHLHRDLLACRHYGLDVLKVSDADRTLATSRLFFAYALGNALLIPFYVGATTWLDPAWPEPEGVLRAVAAFEPTLFFSVPTFYGRLLRAKLPADSFRSVRACISAGE